MKVLSLYTGAGGLDYRFEAAGFDVCVAVDSDVDSCETIRRNRSWSVINAPIRSVLGGMLLQKAGVRRGNADVLIGGPPCQPFSKSSYWVNGDSMRLEDPRADTLYAFMDAIDKFLPKVFLLENVHGLSYSGKEEGILLIEKMTRAINKRANVKYALSWKVLNTANYGVPQTRERFFLVGQREGACFVFPKSTHSGCLSATGLPMSYSENDGFLPFATAWDAIGDLTPSAVEDLAVRGRWARLLPSIPEGENYLWHTNRKSGLPLFGWRTRYWSFLLKLAKNRPSWTIQAQPGPNVGPFHWKNRRLSVDEMSRLQTFPRRLVFHGGRVSVQRQIGNAVPSLMAEILAREIASQFFDVRPTGEPKLLVKPRRPIPHPEAPEPVPPDFLRFVGKHPAHPGEGKGRRAASRQPSGRQQKQQSLL